MISARTWSNWFFDSVMPVASTPIALRGVEQERAPAAADVEEALARRESQLAADVVELLHLRCVESVGSGTEISARVDEIRVEPHGVERIGHVVVVTDVRAIAAALVSPKPPASRQGFLAMRDLADHAFGDRDDAPRAAGEVDVVPDVRPGERPQRRRREGLQPAPRARQDLDFGFRRERDAVAVGQHQRDRQVAPAIAVGDDLFQRFGHGRGHRVCLMPPGDEARPPANGAGAIAGLRLPARSGANG